MRPTEEPVSLVEAQALADKKPEWARKTLPKDDEGRRKIAEAIEKSMPDGTPYYNPALRQNVVNQNGFVVPLSPEDEELDEEVWVQKGMLGTAPPLEDYDPNFGSLGPVLLQPGAVEPSPVVPLVETKRESAEVNDGPAS